MAEQATPAAVPGVTNGSAVGAEGGVAVGRTSAQPGVTTLTNQALPGQDETPARGGRAPNPATGPGPLPPAVPGPGPAAADDDEKPASVERLPSPAAGPSSDRPRPQVAAPSPPAPEKPDDPIIRPGGAPDGVTQSDQLGAVFTFEEYKDSQDDICEEQTGARGCLNMEKVPADAPPDFNACSADPSPVFGRKIPVNTTVKVTMKASCFGDSTDDGS